MSDQLFPFTTGGVNIGNNTVQVTSGQVTLSGPAIIKLHLHAESGNGSFFGSSPNVPADQIWANLALSQPVTGITSYTVRPFGFYNTSTNLGANYYDYQYAFLASSSGTYTATVYLPINAVNLTQLPIQYNYGTSYLEIETIPQ